MGSEKIMTVKNNREKMGALIAFSALIGAVAFIAIYGVRVLNVTYDRWLINNGGDLTNHYIGWLFYRKTPWQFPVGLTEGLVGSDKVSVAYMDSIPLFALFFKALSPILPETFQYFGLYGFVTYILQGVLGALLVYTMTKDHVFSAIGSVFFVLSSVLAMRMFAHSALAFHPVILASMLLYFNGDRIGKGVKSVIYWAVIYLVACSVHAYLVPIVLAFQCAYYLKELISLKWYAAAIKISVCLVLTLAAMYAWGYFYGSSTLAADGLGAFNADLNAMLIDQGTSWFAGSLKRSASTVSWEGYAYMGLGVILLGGVNAFLVLVNHRTELKKVTYPTVLLICVFAFVSTFPVFRLNGRDLFTLPLPSWVRQLVAIFRSNGRFMWPLMYMVMLWVIVSTYKLYSGKAKLLLVLVAVLQIVDLQPLFEPKNSIGDNDASADALSSPIWDELDKDEVFYLYDPLCSTAPWYKIWGYYAYQKDMDLNYYPVSRLDVEALADERQEEIYKVQQGDADPNTLYIINDTSNPWMDAVPLKYLVYNTNLNVYKVDGVYIGVTDELANVEPVSIEDGIDLLEYAPPAVVSVTGADISAHVHSDDAGHYMHADEAFDDYLTLPAGEYRLVMTGDNFDNLNYGLYNSRGPISDVEVVEASDTTICLDFRSDSWQTELRCENTGVGEVLFKNIILYGEQSPYAPGKIEYDARASFQSAGYNADQYIISGVSAPESDYSWTDGNSCEFYFKLPKTSKTVRGSIELGGVFNDSQSVEIYINDELLSKQTLDGEDEVCAFDFPCPEDGVVRIKLLLPGAASPAELGLSGDGRVLSLAIRSISFSELD